MKPSPPIAYWMLQPAGLRFPYPAGRSCADEQCSEPLSRYNPGPFCEACTPRLLRRTRGLIGAMT